MSEIVLLITETNKQSSGFHGTGKGGVLPITKPMCSSVQKVVTGNPCCEKPGQVYQGLWLASQRLCSHHHIASGRE